MSSTRHGAKRNERDYYPTPKQSVHSLLDRVSIDLADHNYGQWLEPAMGDGAIIRAVNNHRSDLDVKWHGMDINTMPSTHHCIANRANGMKKQWQQNYLLFVPAENYEVIITNPPFFLAQEFIEHSLDIANGAVVIMLLRLGMLESNKRSKWWQGKEPDAIYVLADRPDFTGNGGDSCAYGWFFWNWRHKGIFVLE